MRESKITLYFLMVLTVVLPWLIFNPPIFAAEGVEVLSHSLSLGLVPENHSLVAEDVMRVSSHADVWRFELNREFEVLSFKVDGKPVSFRSEKSPRKPGSPGENSRSQSQFLVVDAPQREGEHTVALVYKGIVFHKPQVSQFSREYVASQSSGIISPEGTFLSPESFWYPRGSERMSRFEIRTTTPKGYETVSQGKRLEREERNGKLHVFWKSRHPADVLYLQAGPYTVREQEIEGVALYTYFFTGEEELPSLYLRKSAQYISMYNRLLGPYPYAKFAVVENFFETGYGMPSWTLLGRTVIRLPFIPDTSLPHEICHNWWGNGVFVDYQTGNWCEGLTVYCADYLLKKDIPDGQVDYRRQTNRDYSSYVKNNNDFPLSEFRSRHDPATRSVGYGKSMMVFHALFRKVGEPAFFAALQALMSDFLFQKASWSDVLEQFEKTSDVDLTGFAAQWITRTGAPVLRLMDVSSQVTGQRTGLSFRLVQDEPGYRLTVPLHIETEEGLQVHEIVLTGSDQSFEWDLPASPVRIEVDPEHHLFRRLYPEEIPPSIAKVFGSENQLIVISGKEMDHPDRIKAAEMLNRTQTGKIKYAGDVTPQDLADTAVMILGEPETAGTLSRFLNRIRKPVPWKPDWDARADAGRALVYSHADSPEYAVLLITGTAQSDILSVVRKLPHYGKYGFLLFHGSTNAAKGIWPILTSPMIHNFQER